MFIMKNKKLTLHALIVISICVISGCSATTKKSTNLPSYFKNHTSMANQYKSHCKAVCRVHLSICLSEVMQRNEDRYQDRDNLSIHSNTETPNCRSVCNDNLLDCRCSQNDTECRAECTDTFTNCIEECPAYGSRTRCATQYGTCIDHCDETPECFMDSDCGANAICGSNRKCVSAPRCSTSEMCPQDDNYLCFHGHCILY